MLFCLTFDPQYGIPFYLQYLAHWPEYFIVAEAPGGELMGYSEFVSSLDPPLRASSAFDKRKKKETFPPSTGSRRLL